MLSRAERLGKTAFSQAFSQSRTFHHALLQMRVHRRRSEANTANRVLTARVAFVVAKKLGKATVRNRMRRRLREAYRQSCWRKTDTLHSLDIIFLVKPAGFEAQTLELRAAVDELLARIVQNDFSYRSAGERASGDEMRAVRKQSVSGTSKNAGRDGSGE